jgi:methylthioribose-1-phosphate isomerase
MPRSADYDTFHAEARQLRAQIRDEAVQRVVDLAQTYATELARDDSAHAGRLARRKEQLIEAIHEAHEACRTGPIAEQEIEEAKAIARAREWGERQRRR